MKARALVLAGVLLQAQAWSQPALDAFEDALSLKSSNGVVQATLTGLLDLEGYYVDQRPPGLLFEDESFFNPRLTLFLDTRLGPHFYSFIRARLDRGFDPGETTFEARADEYLLRWTPWENGQLNAQFGKFATVVGSWVQRHDSWDNPLITPPLPYDTLTIVTDDHPPASPAAFLARRRFPDNKQDWLPQLWGPVYATGWGVFGTLGKFDYALDLKNAALSSHPYAWPLNDSLWRYPSVSGRLGFRPATAWNQGLSFSFGPYLSPDAVPDLPPGSSLGDFNQFTLGYDLSYAQHRWQAWAEVFLTRFEVPNVGNADLASYYLELKYKITAGLYAAARWNQQLFGSINDGSGGQQTWGNDMVRVDLALGYRFTRHLQSKLQYSYGHRDASLQQGEQLVAAQVTLRF